MSLIKIQIINWEKYQRRASDIKVPTWFSLSNEYFYDPKMRQFSFRDQSIFIFLLCECSLSRNQTGSFEIHLETVARHLRIKCTTLKTICKSFENAGLLRTLSQFSDLGELENSHVHDMAETLQDMTGHNKEESNKLLSSDESGKKTQTQAIERVSKNSSNNKSEKINFNFKTGKFKNIPSLLMTKWKESFPAVQVEDELTRMETWLLANPKNKKSNYERFITNWLSRAQDRASRSIMNPSTFKVVSKAQAAVNKVMNYKNPYSSKQDFVKVENEK